MVQNNRPRAHEFNNYRDLVAAFVDYKRARNPKISLRSLAQRLGVSSPGFFQDLLSGIRCLPEEKIRPMADILGLNSIETLFFEQLVLADLDLERSLVRHPNILKARGNMFSYPISEGEVELFSRWYLPIVFLLQSFPDFVPEPAWIVGKLGGIISLTEARMALITLARIRLGMPITQLARGDIIGMTFVPPESSEIHSIHRKILRHWTTQIGNHTRRDSTTIYLNAVVDASKVPILQQRLRDFAYELIGEFGTVPGQSNKEIVQVGLYLFPIKRHDS